MDGQGNIYIAGDTVSTDLPTSGTSVQRAAGGKWDAYMAKFDAKGALVFTTYVGGTGSDLLEAFARDAAGNLYLAGTTDSTNFPTSSGVIQTYNRGGSFLGVDAYVAKLDPTGGNLIFGKYLGGNDDDLL